MVDRIPDVGCFTPWKRIDDATGSSLVGRGVGCVPWSCGDFRSSAGTVATGSGDSRLVTFADVGRRAIRGAAFGSVGGGLLAELFVTRGYYCQGLGKY